MPACPVCFSVATLLHCALKVSSVYLLFFVSLKRPPVKNANPTAALHFLKTVVMVLHVKDMFIVAADVGSAS